MAQLRYRKVANYCFRRYKLNDKPFNCVLGESVANWMHLHPVSGLETETEEGLQPGRANDH